jgi:type IV pilus biogenesis protein CpaD/CtpE
MNRTVLKFALLAAAATALAGCETPTRLQPDFGQSLHQNLVAQVADPDAKYSGTVTPASNGARTSLAQTRYQKNPVLQPSVSTTAGIRQAGGGGSPGGGGGAGGAGSGG